MKIYALLFKTTNKECYSSMTVNILFKNPIAMNAFEMHLELIQ